MLGPHQILSTKNQINQDDRHLKMNKPRWIPCLSEYFHCLYGNLIVGQRYRKILAFRQCIYRSDSEYVFLRISFFARSNSPTIKFIRKQSITSKIFYQISTYQFISIDRLPGAINYTLIVCLAVCFRSSRSSTLKFSSNCANK